MMKPVTWPTDMREDFVVLILRCPRCEEPLRTIGSLAIEDELTSPPVAWHATRLMRCVCGALVVANISVEATVND
jgi:hypothetical protein